MDGNFPTYPASAHVAEAELLAPRKSVQGEQRFEVCIIGAGYTGLSAGLHLAQLGYHVAIVDAQRIGWGASGRNGGQLGYGMTPLQPDLVAALGAEVAAQLWSVSVESVELFHQLCGRHRIDCDFRPGNLACATTAKHRETLYRHADLVESYGFETYERFDAAAAQSLSGSQIYQGAILARRAGHLNPLKYALGLARAAEDAGAVLFEASRAEQIQESSPASVQFASGSIIADKVVLACNGYLGSLNAKLARRMLPIDNYQMATEVLDETVASSLLREGVCAWDTSRSVHYFRMTSEGRLIMGCGVGHPNRWPRQLERDCRRHISYVFPQLADVRADYVWRGTLGGNRRGLPDVGRLGANLYYAQSFTGHGVGMAPLLGYYLAQTIHDRSEGFDLLARIPHKNMLPSRKLRPAAIWAYRFATNTMDRLR